AVTPQVGVGSRLVAKLPPQPRVARRIGRDESSVGYTETARIEPLVQPRQRSPLNRLVAVWIDVRSQTVAGSDEVRSRGKAERESALERGHAVQAPSAHQVSHDATRATEELAAFAKRKIDDVVEDDPVTHVEAAQCPLVVEIVRLVSGRRCAGTAFEP